MIKVFYPPISKVCQMTLKADEIRLIMSPSEMKVRRGPHREQEKKEFCSGSSGRKEVERQTKKMEGERERVSGGKKGKEKKHLKEP